ncbi:hypothetical protein BJ944DRAFT_233534 [Cunninghamella echinulata]|nr:hypothetical protein BJ944DRAFT_233534 [Cunninghamella echinulata]
MGPIICPFEDCDKYFSKLSKFELHVKRMHEDQYLPRTNKTKKKSTCQPYSLNYKGNVERYSTLSPYVENVADYVCKYNISHVQYKEAKIILLDNSINNCIKKHNFDQLNTKREWRD